MAVYVVVFYFCYCSVVQLKYNTYELVNIVLLTLDTWPQHWVKLSLVHCQKTLVWMKLSTAELGCHNEKQFSFQQSKVLPILSRVACLRRAIAKLSSSWQIQRLICFQKLYGSSFSPWNDQVSVKKCDPPLIISGHRSPRPST